MQSSNPSRRHLLGGILAGLFGWLLPRRGDATSPQAQPGTHRETILTNVQTFTYDSQGQPAGSSEQLSRHGTIEFICDGNGRLTTIRYC
jgi:YD repeat-containing protein